MAVFETWLDQDLKKPVRIQYLSGNLFSQDNMGNLIGVNVTDDGAPATLGGSVSANVIRADGATVAVDSGVLSGNRASVTLPQAAYAVPGVITVVIKITSGTDVTTLAAVVTTVYRSSTDTIVDPGTIIPSIQTLISQIETAVASIPSDYSSLWTTLAPAYSTSATYAVGQYVTYNGGLYRCTTAITSAESWTAAHWTAAKVGNDLSDLKSAINGTCFSFLMGSNGSYAIAESDLVQGSYSPGANDGSANRISVNKIIPVYPGIRVNFVGGTKCNQVYFRELYGDFSAVRTLSWGNKSITVDWTGYLMIVFRNSGNTNITPSDYDAQLTMVTTFSPFVRSNEAGIYDVIYDFSKGTVTATVDRDFDSPAYDLTISNGVLRGTRNSETTTHPVLLKQYVKKCQFYRGTPTSMVVAYDEKSNTALELNLSNGNFIWCNFNNPTYGQIKTYTLTNTVGGNKLVKCDYDGNNITITTTDGNLVVVIPGEDLQGYAVRYGWENGQSGSNFIATNVEYIKPFYYEPPIVDLSGKLINRMKDKKVFFIGDSITNAGHGTESWRWQNQIETDLGITASNYGVSQTCMTATSESDTNAMCIRYADMESDADYVFCMAGINDFGTNKPLGSLESTDITDFTGALKTFIEGVYTKYIASTNYQFKLYYACPYHVTDYFQSETNSLGLTQLDYVNRAKEICAMYGVPFLNMYESSGFNKMNEAYLLYDHLHPGQTGNKLLANVIGLFLSTH